VDAAKDILFGKLSSALTSDVKPSCWLNITEKVNSVSGGVIRTDKAVKKKWVDLCSVVKKNEAAQTPCAALDWGWRIQWNDAVRC